MKDKTKASESAPASPPLPSLLPCVDSEFVAAVERELGMGHGAWDMEKAEDVCRAVLEVADKFRAIEPFCPHCDAQIPFGNNTKRGHFRGEEFVGWCKKMPPVAPTLWVKCKSCGWDAVAIWTASGVCSKCGTFAYPDDKMAAAAPLPPAPSEARIEVTETLTKEQFDKRFVVVQAAPSASPNEPVECRACAFGHCGECEDDRCEHDCYGVSHETSTYLRELVRRFSKALLEKLLASEAKYGWNNGWREDDWRDALLADIRKHVEKGDPRDVAAYCAFAWHHNWSLANSESRVEAPAPLPSSVGCGRCGLTMVTEIFKGRPTLTCPSCDACDHGNATNASVDTCAATAECRKRNNLPEPSAAPSPTPYKGAINQPCSACSAGDTSMTYHDHDYVRPENRVASPTAAEGERPRPVTPKTSQHESTAETSRELGDGQSGSDMGGTGVRPQAGAKPREGSSEPASVSALSQEQADRGSVQTANNPAPTPLSAEELAPKLVALNYWGLGASELAYAICTRLPGVAVVRK